MQNSTNMTKEELQSSFEQYRDALFAAINQAMSQKISTSKGFMLLSHEILRRTGKSVSESTLKRIYGYVSGSVEARESTLDILSLFVGYTSWQQFCSAQQVSHTVAPSSGFVNARTLEVSQLPLHTIVRFTWAPDRICSCLYCGEGRFEVLRSENTRLVPGSLFKCSFIVADQPLVLSQVLFSGKGIPATYVIGRTYGIHFDLVIP